MAVPAHTTHSLSRRLTTTFVALLAVLLVILGLVQYASLRTSLINERIATFDGDMTAGTSLFQRSGAVRTLTLEGAAQRFATLLTTVSGRTVSAVVYGPDLTALATAPAGATSPQLDAATLRSAATPHSAAQELITPDGVTYLTVVYPITLPAGRVYIQINTPMQPVTAVLNRDLIFLMLSGGIALFVAAVLGVRLTSRGLRPLRRLTETAGELSRGDLAARSRLVHGDDEVGALGRAIDDMAERIEAAFAARAESEAQVRRFIADASHELRTPVTALKGYIDVMRRGAGRDPGSLDAILESMQREAERMRVLVLDLLTLARLDAQAKPELQPVDVNEIVSGVLDDGVPGMPGRVDRELAPGPLLARADGAAVTTIARNLLVNACKYAPGAAQRWSTAVHDGTVVIGVHDDGPGIPAADLPHVFERFYRGEKTRAREEGGSGLGLSIVQGLARTMGGDAAIESAEGAGTTVTITLPRA